MTAGAPAQTRDMVLPERAQQQAVANVRQSPNQWRADQINDLWMMCKRWTASGMMPSHIKTPEQAFTIAMMGATIGVEYMIAIQTMFVVHGKTGMEAKLARGLILSHPICEYMYFEKCTPTEATIVYKRRTTPKEQRESLTMAQCKQANWHQVYKDGRWEEKAMWKQIPDVMIQERLQMRIARRDFADVIQGMALYSYDELNVPMRVNDAGEPELDETKIVATIEHEASPATAEAPAETPGSHKIEPLISDIVTEDQKNRMRRIMQAKQGDGKTLLLPAEYRRTLADFMAKEKSSSKWEAMLLAAAQEVNQRRNDAGLEPLDLA